MRSLLTALVVGVLVSVAFASPDRRTGLTDLSLLKLIKDDTIFATADLTLLLSSSGTATHYGPYPSISPDSGTCGNFWAEDTFDRHFTVRHNDANGTYTVIQQFKDGRFETDSGSSPGACDLDEPENTGGMVADGIIGSMYGYFIIPLGTTTQTSTDPHCNATLGTNNGCTTTVFVDTHFTPCYAAGTCQVTTFFFRYNAGDQALVEREWKNASDDRGGNRGDIRSP